MRCAGIVLASICAVGCVFHTPLNLTPDIQLPPRSAVIFFVDGMDHARFTELMASEALPNIRKRFVEGGVAVKNAIVSMPSVTYANSTSLITGCFPGHHGILGNLWFDRQTLQLPDYAHADSYRTVNEHFDRATLYEALAPLYSANVQGHTRRGVTLTLDNEIPTAIDWFAHRFSRVDARVGRCVAEVARHAQRKKRWPSVLLFYFPGVDEIGHRYGVDGNRYREAMGVVDRSIGLVCDALMNSSLAERTYWVLVTDHSHVPTPPQKSFDLHRHLEQDYGLRVHQGRLTAASLKGRLRQLGCADAVLITGEGRRAALHLRNGDDWSTPADPNEVNRLASALAALPAVDIAAHSAGPNRIKILSRNGSAIVYRKTEGSLKMYRLSGTQGDALLYRRAGTAQNQSAGGSRQSAGRTCHHPLALFVNGGFHDSRSWLQATAETDYPDFVPQVVEMFDSPRAGDIVLFAADDYAFGGHWKGGHGSCLARDMRIPMYFAGPDLPAGGSIYCARLVDCMPTVLDLLGEVARLADIMPIDGISIASQLRNASPDVAQENGDPGAVLPNPGLQPTHLRPGDLEPLGRDR